MKNKILIVISALLLMACSSTPEFTRIIRGKARTGTLSDSLIYQEVILVNNTPKDTLKQIKMLIAYYDSMGISLHELKQRGDLGGYSMFFVKDTKDTRKLYLEDKKDIQTNPNKTHIGSISVFRTDEGGDLSMILDSTKWKFSVYINIGNDPDAEYTGVNIRCYPLYDESDPAWWEHHKDSTMLQYDPIWKHICKDGRVINYFKKLQKDKLQ